MSAPYVPGPGDTNPYPMVAPGKKKFAAWKIAALAVLGVVVMCVSGLFTLGLFIGPQPKPAATVRAAPATTMGPAPVDSVSPAPSLSPSPTRVVTTAPALIAPTIPAPTVAPRAVPKPAPSKPRPHITTTKPKPPTKPPAAGAVHPGAFCAPEGALGHTTAGTLMRCTRKAGEDRARWRKA